MEAILLGAHESISEGQMNERKEYLIKITPIVLIILNLILKLIFITSNSIGGDEPFSIYHAQMNIPSILHHLTSGNNPPFYEIFLHFWIGIFGIGELSVRLPSLFFSALTVYFIYRIGKDFFSYRIALISSLLFSFSNYHIFFAHEARVYPLFALLTSMSMFYFLKICKCEKREGIKYYILLLIINIVMLYAHYFAFFVIFIQTISVVFIKDIRKREIKRYLLFVLFLVILYIPNIYTVAMRLIDSSTNGTWIKPVENIGNLHGMVYLFSNENRWAYLLYISILWIAVGKYLYQNITLRLLKVILAFFVTPLFLITSVSIYVNMPFIWRLTSEVFYSCFFLLTVMFFAVLIIFTSLNKGTTICGRVVAMWFLFPFIIMFSISFKYIPHNIPMFFDRYMVFLSVGYFILLAIAINYIFSKFKYHNYLLALPVIIMMATCTPNVDNKRHVKETVAKIKELKDNKSIVLICPQYFVLNFTYYYDQEIFKDVDNLNVYEKMHEKLIKQGIYPINNINEVNLEGANSVLFLDAAARFLFPDNNIVATLERNYKLKQKYNFYEIFTVYEFQLKNV